MFVRKIGRFLDPLPPLVRTYLMEAPSPQRLLSVTYQSCLVFAIYRPRELSHLVAQVSPSPSSDVPVAPGGCEAAQTRSEQIIIRP